MTRPSTIKAVPSVTQTMARMAMRMDALLDAQHKADPSLQDGEIPDEIRFWLSVDPLLAHLHKQMADARQAHMLIAQRHGAEDVMTDVAADMQDSAQTAFETRLLELRRQEEKQREVDALIKAALEKDEAERTAAVRARSKAFWQDFARPRRKMSAAAVRGSEQIWLVLCGLIMLQNMLSQTAQELSAACDFSRAAGTGHDRTLRHVFAGGAA